MPYRLLVLPLMMLPLVALAETDQERLTETTTVLKEMMNAGDKGIPGSTFQKAECAVIIPGLKKGGFIVSAKYGRGFATCRKPGGTGWSAPAAMRIEGGGVGLQIGGEATDIIMLVMSEKGMKGILSSKFTLGGDASIAGGPVGREATAQTDASMRADILSWSRARGVFGALALEGGTLREDSDVNQALYGKKVTNNEILTGKVKPTADDTAFIAEVTKYGGATRKK
jgi:SH3 domain-containing YSC84-like protein 1